MLLNVLAPIKSLCAIFALRTSLILDAAITSTDEDQNLGYILCHDLQSSSSS
jgi:hypothetical protein